MAVLVREAVDRYLARSNDVAFDPDAPIPLVGAVGRAERARDVAERHDAHLARARLGDPPPKRAPRGKRRRP